MRIALIAGLLALTACSPVKPISDASVDASAAASFAESASASLATEAVLLPQAFIGHWDASLDACKATSDMKVIVTQTELTFWESRGLIKSVTINGPDEVTVRAAFSGEGEQWDRAMHMVLADNGQTLKVDDTARVRCP
ncbi:MAG: hypothetical protein NVV72_17255 [Asticcacaulis sp.]|nr:hypothetical protein [Asticcacaulis sp.]